MKQQSNPSLSVIESAICATGARVTFARVEVLSILRSAKLPLSHSDIEAIAEQAFAKIDRVTLYRVLDWLVEIGLAHKVANTRGVFCFTAVQADIRHKEHAHFRCNDCGNVICLDIAPPPLPKLPNGFNIATVELDISGECPDCVQNSQRSDWPLVN